jgi:hypothetical protein
MIAFPKLHFGKILSEEKEKKEVIFRNYPRAFTDKPQEEQPYKVNNVVRNARENYTIEVPSPSDIPARINAISIRTQLLPINKESQESIKQISNGPDMPF